MMNPMVGRVSSSRPSVLVKVLRGGGGGVFASSGRSRHLVCPGVVGGRRRR